MKRIILLILAILSLAPLAKAQWQSISTPQYSNPNFSCTHQSLGAVASNYRIYWSHSANCAAGGMGQFDEYEIYATADLGNSWFSKIYNNYTNMWIQAMDFVSGDTGYYIHNYDYLESQVFRTNDYFTSIEQCFCAELFIHRHSVMLNYNDLYIIDTDARIFHLENDTIKLIYNLPIELKEWGEDPTISAIGINLFVTCKSYPNNTYENDLILNSYDGGYSWDTSFISTSVHINTLKFSSDNLGFAIGNSGVIMRTQDAGQTWENINSGTVNNLLCIDFMNEQTWIVGGKNATLLLTEDNGETWQSIYLPPSTSSVWSVKFPEKDEIVFIRYLGLKRASIYNLTKVPKQIKLSENFKIFPNPAKDEFTIEINDSKLINAYAEFYNLLGDKVFSHFINQEHEVVDFSTFPKGIYIVKVVNQGETSIQRLLVQ